MPAIFISHSSADRKVSGDIKAALDRLGLEHPFLDFDKVTGLNIGENWEKRLYEELSRCHAVLLVLTPAWLASKWCFAELTQARALGKVILWEVPRFPFLASKPIRSMSTHRSRLVGRRA